MKYKFIVKIQQTPFKGLRMEFYDCAENKYLFDTWKNVDTLEKWCESFEKNNIKITDYYSLINI